MNYAGTKFTIRRSADRTVALFESDAGASAIAAPIKYSFTFDVKLAVSQHFLAGETKTELTREFGLSSPKLIDT